jgi:DNA mismatch repair protein MutS2
MLQCGILVPINESSRAGIFQHIFIDIGDEQSIENDLSTYSSHLLNLKYFIKNCNEKTLLLIDEFGSGTEPQIGGAIAEACLERFNGKKAFGVITTHYTNLKHFAQDTDGVVNVAMLYDRQHLQPLFILQIGNPGSSFAVEIARKIGLPEDVIDEAAQKAGTEQLNYDKYLLEIARDKRYWERKREEIHQKEKRLDESLRKYEDELKTTDSQRKEILNKSKQQAENLLKEANAKIENTIKTIKESQAEKEKTRAARQELENFKKNIESNFIQPELTKKVVQNSSKKKLPSKSFIPKEKISENKLPEKTTYQINQSVRIKDQTAIGTILEINEKQAVVAFGQMKTTAKISDLEIVSNNEKKSLKRKKENSFQTITDDIRDRKLNFKSEIDVRGMRADDALQAVTYFIDDALMVGISRVRILHGKGNGILLQLIRQYLGTVSGIKSFHDEHVQFGGSGITVVEFE